MANVVQTSFSHTYAGKEILTDIFFAPEENVPAISELYKFIQTVDKSNIYLPAKLRKIFRKYSTCGFSAAGGTLNITDKVISTEKIKANVEECVDQFTDTIFAEVLKTGVNVDDLSNTIIDQIIRRQIVNAAKSDIHRMLWFADAADADSDWNQFDGFISLFLDNSAAIGADCFLNLDPTAFEASDVLAADGALGAMRQLWGAQSAELRAMDNKVFYVTHTVADNLRTTYEDTQSSQGLQRLISTNGKEMLSFRGVPVIEVPEWDANLADSTNPHYTGSGLSIGSNLIVYTTPDNLIFGSDVVSPGNEFKFRYNDDDSEKLKVVSKFKLGAQFVHPSLVCIAY